MEIDWLSIRALARLFDETGDDLVDSRARFTALSSTASLVGDDEDGRTFQQWYTGNYEKLTLSMRDMAESNFSMATALHDFKKLWALLDDKIIKSLPDIPDIPQAPIPEVPPAKVGA